MSLTGMTESNYKLIGKIKSIPKIDKTLTKENHAAEALATGTAIKELTNSVSNAVETAKSAKNATETIQTTVKAHASRHAVGGADPLSAAQVGAAPAGYGLGADGRVVTDCELATANGWYVTAGASNAPSGFSYGWMHVSSRYGTTVRQDYFTATTPPQHWVRYCNSGTWGVWGCENPPLVTGQEYRTTELWNGKPIYTKVIDCGNFPSDSDKTVTHNISEIDQIVSIHGWSSYLGLALPYYASSEIKGGAVATVSATRNAVVVTCNVTQWVEHVCYAQLKYTKK